MALYICIYEIYVDILDFNIQNSKKNVLSIYKLASTNLNFYDFTNMMLTQEMKFEAATYIYRRSIFSKTALALDRNLPDQDANRPTHNWLLTVILGAI